MSEKLVEIIIDNNGEYPELLFNPKDFEPVEVNISTYHKEMFEKVAMTDPISRWARERKR